MFVKISFLNIVIFHWLFEQGVNMFVTW